MSEFKSTFESDGQRCYAAIEQQIGRVDLLTLALTEEPLLIDDVLAMSTTDVDSLEDCVERYGWPSEDDEQLIKVSQQYPDIIWDNQTFKRLLTGDESPSLSGPQYGLGSFYHFFTVAPDRSFSYPDNLVGWRPALQRGYEVMPELLTQLRTLFEITKAKNPQAERLGSLRFIREMTAEPEGQELITEAMKLCFLILRRLVKESDYLHDPRFGDDKECAYSNKVVDILCA